MWLGRTCAGWRCGVCDSGITREFARRTACQGVGPRVESSSRRNSAGSKEIVMNLVRFLFRYSRKTMIWTALAALVSGACNAGLIALVNILLGGTGRPVVALLWWFVALGTVRLLTNYIAQVSLARFSQRGTASLRRDLVR